MSDKTNSSVGMRSFETISEEDTPWDTLLTSERRIPTIIKTDASCTTISHVDDVEANKLTRSKSFQPPRRNSSTSTLLGSFHKQLRLSLRGVRSEPSSVKDVKTTRNDSQFFFNRYRQSRFHSRRIRKRVIFKHGDCNVVQWNVAKRRRRYLQDLFTTLVDAQWRWTLMIFALSFLLSWLGFALVWWLIIFTHGDLNPENLSSNNTDWRPCLSNVNSFTGCFLFSVETQHTIGYGGRVTNEECPEAIFVMCLQSIVGVFIQAFMEGLIFAKMARAKKRNTTLQFSTKAVICLRDGEYCLVFRVGDIRKSHILEAHVRALIIWKKVTREGEILPFYQQELKVGADGEEDRLMFIWPMTIVHKINEKSPLYTLSATDMLREKFEIVVMLEGVIESTGMTTQARSSYLPSEVLWGNRFEPMVSFRKDTGEYEVDYTRFNNTYEVDTPLCSAKQLDELRATVSTSQKLDRILGTIPKTFSNDTLDLSSMDSMSLDEHIEIKIPEARARENRLMAQNNFAQQPHVNHNASHQHLCIENETNGGIPKLPNGHKKPQLSPNGIGHNALLNHDENKNEHDKLDKHHGLKRLSSQSDLQSQDVAPVPVIPILVTSPEQDPA